MHGRRPSSHASRPSEILPGAVLDDTYRVERLLGKTPAPAPAPTSRASMLVVATLV